MITIKTTGMNVGTFIDRVTDKAKHYDIRKEHNIL